MKDFEQAVKYLDELENILVKVETRKEYSYEDVLAALRCGYWTLKEFLRVERRYNELLKRMEDK